MIEELGKLVEDIRDEAQWLIRIVENLLSVTRINGENAQIHTEEEIVEEIVGSAVLKFQKRFPEVKVEVLMPEAFLMVPMDGILIEQVLVNLLENSVLHGKTIDRIRIIVGSCRAGSWWQWRTTVKVSGNQSCRLSLREACIRGKEKNVIPDATWESACPSA